MIPYVLYGLTGSGKTALLRLLAPCFPVIDLELLAAHNGSAFGNLKKQTQPSQQQFNETVERLLAQYQYAPLIFLEYCGEQLGSIRMPPGILSLIHSAKKIVIESTPQQRVEQLLAQYLPASQDALNQALDKLSPRLKTSVFLHLRHLLEEECYTDFCMALLPYYDRAKRYAIPANPDLLLTHGGVRENYQELLRQLHLKPVF